MHIFGLESDEGRKLNGLEGELRSFSQEKGRWNVLVLESGVVRAVKPANLKVRSVDHPENTVESMGRGGRKKHCTTRGSVLLWLLLPLRQTVGAGHCSSVPVSADFWLSRGKFSSRGSSTSSLQPYSYSYIF